MLKDAYPYYLANQAVFANQDLEVTHKYTGKTVTRVAMADVDAIDRAIAKAVAAEGPMAALPAWKRAEILEHCVSRFRDRQDDLADTLCIEAGKPIKDARGEVTRLIDTFRIAAQEAVRIYGEVLPMDISERVENYTGLWRRFPIGPCSFISPFNFPLNLAAHKIAPAIAAGCPFILKPASLTPLGALIIGEVLADADLPEGAFSILPCHRDGAGLFSEDPRLKLLSFTGSPDVGWKLKKNAGKKKVVLELGGNAACIIDEGTDLEDAVERVITGAFYQSGQSCISVQRLIVHESLYDDFRDRLVTAARDLKTGDPSDDDTFIGPIISEDEAGRIEDWIREAQDKGATLLCGGKRDGTMIPATLLENVPDDVPLSCQEAFGPVAILESFSEFDTALARVNQSRYGLQAGVFTRDIDRIQRAFECLRVGGVIINDVPSWRVDHMPYGGIKDSGLGREGLRFAIEDMTEIRLLAIRRPQA